MELARLKLALPFISRSPAFLPPTAHRTTPARRESKRLAIIYFGWPVESVAQRLRACFARGFVTTYLLLPGIPHPNHNNGSLTEPLRNLPEAFRREEMQRLQVHVLLRPRVPEARLARTQNPLQVLAKPPPWRGT